MKNVALITGASSGIGEDLAHIHAENGGDLVVVARSEDKLNQLKETLEAKHKIKVKVIVQDLAEIESAQIIYDQIKADGINIEFLINNAGFGGVGNFHERAWEKDYSMMMVNMIIPTHLTRLFLPDLVAQGSGKILNVSSTASFLPGPGQAVYYATKAYMQFFTNAIAEEVKASGITVTNLMPGATKTGFGDRSGMNKTDLFAQTVSSRSVAEDGYNGMIKGDLDVITGLNFSTRLTLKLLPFIPKKMMLTKIYQAQQIKK